MPQSRLKATTKAKSMPQPRLNPCYNQLEQEMYCRGIYYLYEYLSIFSYSIISPSLVLKPESYFKRGGGGGGGGVFSSEYSTQKLQVCICPYKANEQVAVPCFDK